MIDMIFRAGGMILGALVAAAVLLTCEGIGGGQLVFVLVSCIFVGGVAGDRAIEWFNMRF